MTLLAPSVPLRLRPPSSVVPAVPPAPHLFSLWGQWLREKHQDHSACASNLFLRWYYFFLLTREYVDCHGSSVTSPIVKATPRSLPPMFPDLPFQPQIVGWSKSVLTKYCAPVLFAHSFSNHPKTSCGKEFCRAGTIEKCFLVFNLNPLPASLTLCPFSS